MFNENLKSTTKSENKYKDRIMFDPFLMPKFIKDLGGCDDDIDEVMGKSSVLYRVNNNKKSINYCIPINDLKDRQALSIVSSDIIGISDTLDVFPDYVFGCLNDEKVKLYVSDYLPLVISDDFTCIENFKDEKVKVAPILNGINIYLMEAIADSIDDKFDVFTETDEFNEIYKYNKVKIQELNDNIGYCRELDTPVKFLASCLFSYYTYDEYFHCGCGEVCHYIENIDNKLKEMYGKKNNKVLTKNGIKNKR